MRELSRITATRAKAMAYEVNDRQGNISGSSEMIEGEHLC
jgi:hypothetical protein